MLNKELEQSLNKAFHEANEKRHEFITVEHLLLMLTENDAASAVLEACGGDVAGLKKELEIFVDQNIPLLMADDNRDTQSTLGFQRVLQRALFHVQSSGNGEVSGANVLVANFSSGLDFSLSSGRASVSWPKDSSSPSSTRVRP